MRTSALLRESIRPLLLSCKIANITARDPEKHSQFAESSQPATCRAATAVAWLGSGVQPKLPRTDEG